METIGILLFALMVLAAVAALLLHVRGSKRESNHLPANVFGGLTEPLAFTLPIGNKKKSDLQKELIFSGQYHSNALINFLALRNLSTLVCLTVLAYVLWSELIPNRDIEVLATGISLAVFFYSLPRILLGIRARSRSRQIEHALPDALDMISMSIEGGVPIQKAIHRVATEFQQSHPPLAEELGIVSRQTEASSIQVALGQFAQRVDSEDLIAWSAMLGQSQKLGVGVVDSMRDYADRIRENRKQQAEQNGQTATVKLLLPVVLCMAPPIFVILIGPAILDFRNFINRERNAAVELIQQANETVTGRQRQAEDSSSIP